MRRTEYLIDRLGSAAIEAAADNCVDVERMIIDRQVETAIFQHPPAKIAFPPLEVGAGARLILACGIKEVAWPLLKTAVRFTITAAVAGRQTTLLDTKLDPRRRAADRGWQQHELDLSQFAGQSIQFIFQTLVGWRRSTEYAWSGWANPRIDHEVKTASAPRRRDQHSHIFLLTADALPASYLGCYGHAEVKTPSLDQLAEEGILFEQAWSQSCTTLGSYVSILTGLHSHEHGVSREWQSFPLARPNLAKALESQGFHTAFIASSGELAGRRNYLERVFNEIIPTFANPMQDGAVTNRQFFRWFDRRPDQPTFSWIHYFDVHPPSMPPAPFSEMYYSGDPTDVRHEYAAADVLRIRAVESILLLRASMPVLERGSPVAEVVDVLTDTAAVLRGESNQQPDLAEHILNLGEQATRGMPRVEFARWLAKQTDELASGHGSVELVQWLRELMSLLERTESDILFWLQGVVDFRYPVAIYQSTVSYFDHHIQSFVDSLKERDLYDQSLIIVTAPHGEIIESRSLPYHHFALAPETLHVPLIMKLPLHVEHRPGARIGGVMDLIDLFPTIMDVHGLKHSLELSGLSRWEQIKAGRDLPERYSFASGLHQLTQSVCRPPYLFVREKPDLNMQGFHTVLTGTSELVYDTRSGEVCEIAAEIRDELRKVLTEHTATKSVDTASAG